jgi:acyl carrier protein
MTDTISLSSVITEIVAVELGRSASELSPDTDLRSVEGADSIKVLRMVAKIEQAYDIELPDDEIFALKTIDEVVTVVGRAIERDHS